MYSQAETMTYFHKNMLILKSSKSHDICIDIIENRMYETDY